MKVKVEEISPIKKKLVVEVETEQIKKEWECSNSEGNLFRMDRVIVDENAVTVIDFKTGKEKGGEERDLLQVRRYIGILGEIYPGKKIEGMIANIDSMGTRRIV